MTLFDLLVLLKRNWLLVAAVPVACALVALGVTLAWPPMYTFEESVLAAWGATPPIYEYVVIAFLAGLLAALAIVIIKDAARGTVHNACEVEENYDLRLLGSVRSASSRRRSDAAAADEGLLAALDFAGKDEGEGARAVCLIPLEDAEAAERIVVALEAVAETAGKRLACVRENADLTLPDQAAVANAIASRIPSDAALALILVPPVAESADFAYVAPACGRAVLVVEAMRTTRAHLEAALRQLSLSETPLAGFIMVNAA